jgi:hypothetical protein
MMNILYPMFLMALLAFVIGPMILMTRISSVKNGVVQMSYYEIFRGGEPPASVIQTTRHWSNLFEAPMLFYIVCLMALVLHIESTLLIGLAWAYVTLRIMHSCVHLTYNEVNHRLALFLLSQFVLVAMWIVAFIEII